MFGKKNNLKKELPSIPYDPLRTFHSFRLAKGVKVITDGLILKSEKESENYIKPKFKTKQKRSKTEDKDASEFCKDSESYFDDDDYNNINKQVKYNNLDDYNNNNIKTQIKQNNLVDLNNKEELYKEKIFKENSKENISLYRKVAQQLKITDKRKINSKSVQPRKRRQYLSKIDKGEIDKCLDENKRYKDALEIQKERKEIKMTYNNPTLKLPFKHLRKLSHDNKTSKNKNRIRSRRNIRTNFKLPVSKDTKKKRVTFYY